MVKSRRRDKVVKLPMRYIKWAIAVLLLAAVLFYAYSVHSVYSTRIGVIQVEGEIDDFRYVDQVKAAIEDPSIRAVVVVINSPGGTVDACFETETQLSELNSMKPVVVTMSEYGASGAYLIASASDYIFAHRQTVTAGLGVIAVWVSYENKFEKEGIKYYRWLSGELKDEFAPWRGPTPEENARIQKLVDDLMEELFRRIQRNRTGKQSIRDIDNLRDGSTVYGWEALQYNLIDEIGDRSDAMKKAAELAGLKEDEYLVVDMANPPSFWSALRQSL
jgi:protease-4